MPRRFPRILILLPVAVSAARAEEEQAPRMPALLQRGLLGFGVAPALQLKSRLVHQPLIEQEISPTLDQKARMQEVEKAFELQGERLAARMRDSIKQLGLPPDPGLRATLLDNDPAARRALAVLLEKDAVARRALAHDLDAAVMRILDERQGRRLSQIQLQAEGPMAFTRPELRQRLGLSAEQEVAIKSLVSRGRLAMYKPSMALSENLPDFSRASRQEIQERKESKSYQLEIARIRQATLRARDDTTQGILEVLSEAQRAEYRRSLGRPFPFDRIWEDMSPLPENQGGDPTSRVR